MTNYLAFLYGPKGNSLFYIGTSAELPDTDLVDVEDHELEFYYFGIKKFNGKLAEGIGFWVSFDELARRMAERDANLSPEKVARLAQLKMHA